MKKIIKTKWFISIRKIISTCLFISLLTIFCITINKTVKEYSDKNEDEKIVEYILENYNHEKVILYNDFNNGGYTEYMGLKSYIDSRAELFVKEFNGKEDILREFSIINSNAPKEQIEKIIKKYNFTHIIANNSSSLNTYLNNNDNFIMEYANFTDNENRTPDKLLYVRKDISVQRKKITK